MIEIIQPITEKCKLSDIPEGGYFYDGSSVFYRGPMSLDKKEVSVAKVELKPATFHWRSAWGIVVKVKDIKLTVQL